MAFHDARDLPDGHTIESDVCIIGSGAAGLAVASHFLDGPARVALLESGGFEAEGSIQALYEGTMAGMEDSPLHTTRLRYWGGTTNHWTAWLHPLEPIDFEPRPWVPHSVWSVSLSEIEPWYERAIKFFGIAREGFDPARVEQPLPPPWPLAPDLVSSHRFQILAEQQRRLGPLFRPRVAASRNVDAYLHASVLSIETDASTRRVTGVRTTSDGRSQFLVRARRYVIAAGGIENARLLLLSTATRPAGLGNDHGLVGRYFGNHLSAHNAAELHPTAPGMTAEFFLPTPFEGVQAIGWVALRQQVQKEHRLLNCHFHAGTAEPWGVGAAARDRDIRDWAATVDRLGSPADPGVARGPVRDPAPPFFRLSAIAEQTPNPESRVRLGEGQDRFGQRRVVLDWKLTADDARSVEHSLGLLARAAGAGGVGRVRLLFPEGAFRFVDVRGSYHHMGTTRMHDDPKRGVVNRHCRVHGVENLFVAGSSVFPTFGTVNPTLTIVALALRLADHLKGGAR